MIAAASPPGAFTERPMGSDDITEQATNLLEVAAAARQSNLWGLLVGDNHAIPPSYANLFQPVPTIARLSAETGTLSVGMVLLAPFYHPLLLAEQIGTLSAFVDAPLIVTFASGGHDGAFDAFGYTKRSRGVRTEELIPVVRSLLAGEAVTARGRSFELENATISPLPDIQWSSGSPARTRSRRSELAGWERAAVEARATADQTTTSDVIREALRRFLDVA